MSKQERVYIKIGGIHFFMEELEFFEDKELIRLLKKNLKSFSSMESLSILGLMEVFESTNVLNDFLNLVLKATDKPRWKMWFPVRANHVRLKKGSEDGSYDFENIKNSELENVINAFFLLNQSVMKKLEEYATNLTTMLTAQKLAMESESSNNGKGKTRKKKESKSLTKN